MKNTTFSGMVVTIQIGAHASDYGKSYKIAPVTSDIPGKIKRNVKTCFLVNGTKTAPISIQSILPNLTGFHVCGALFEYFFSQCKDIMFVFKLMYIYIIRIVVTKYLIGISFDMMKFM